MSSFRNLVFVKDATNTFGQFKKGGRAQGRFPEELVESYLKLGILEEVPEPIALDGAVKDYTPPRARKRAAKTTK
ncbi:hypothetical protein E4695_16095 [Alcaligenaceae bacterium 429]|nr:hypothetical protein E4695_16095 [Alcaligenaceae bacterium 429]